MSVKLPPIDYDNPLPPEREPLLWDNEVSDIYDALPDYEKLSIGDPIEPTYRAAWFDGACDIRDHYERLIDEGKLIVAKEVELWHPTVPEEEWRTWLTGSDAEFSMLVTKCCGKNPWVPPWLSSRGQWDDNGTFRMTKNEFVCPGCGGKIKR